MVEEFIREMKCSLLLINFLIDLRLHMSYDTENYNGIWKLKFWYVVRRTERQIGFADGSNWTPEGGWKTSLCVTGQMVLSNAIVFYN